MKRKVTNMILNTINWKEFSIEDLFEVTAGCYYSDKECGKGDTPYISATNKNNGIGKMIDLPPDFEGNNITIGKVGANAYYQPEPFSATSDVNVLIPKFEMDKNIGLFIVMLINKSANYKFDYCRQCRIGDTKKIKISLPIDNNGNIDLNWISTYMKSLQKDVDNKIEEIKSISIGGSSVLNYLLSK